ncbi:putative nucleic acid-binding protein [Bradyrhizobium sp. LA7.1]
MLDTNVVSEAMKPDPHPSVRDWPDAQAAEAAPKVSPDWT